MSLLPYVMRDMSRTLRMLENQFRFADDFFHPMVSSPFFRSLPNQLNSNENYSVVQDKDKFEVKLDVQSFKPEEIVVKTVDNNAIQIEAKQSGKSGEDGGIASKYFARIFVLPQGHDLKDVVSSLSSNGILTVTAPKKPEAEFKERVIPITHTKAKEEEISKLGEKKSE